MKNKRSRFRVLLALILTVTILTLPLDTFALTGDRSDSPSAAANTATPDEANPDGAKPDEVKPEKTAKELSAVGAGTLSGDGSQENPYIVASASDWDALADSVLDGTSYADKYIELTEDISVTRSLGHTDDISSASSPSYEFDGTFDGGGHTMTFTPPADSNANYVAPFSIVKNATIRNLKVEGEITAFNNLSGLVGAPKGTLMVENVLVDVDVEGNFIGGFVGHGVMADMTFRSCAFTGNLNGDTLAGGFVCWRGPVAWEASGNPALHIENCLFAGSASGAADFHPIGFTQQTNVSAEISDMWATADGQNNGKGFYNYQYQGTSYRSTAATVVSGISSTRPWMGYFDVIDCPPVEGSFSDALNAWTVGSTLALLTNVTTDSTVSIPSGEHTLDLNGHGIKMTGSGGVIKIPSDADLTLIDSRAEGNTHYYYIDSATNLAVLASTQEAAQSGNSEKNGSFTGGYLTGGNNPSYDDQGGGGILVLGKLTMNNGTVIGNYVAGAGGGINVCSGGNASITGANIIGNKTGNVGGGVDIPNYANTVVALEQCVIRHNHANSNTGGIAARGGRVTLKDCDVLDNTAQNNSAGFVAQNCHLTLENVNIKGNITANSSGTYAPGITLRNSNYNNCSFTLKGAVTVEKNTMAGKADDSIYIHNGRNIAVGGELTYTVPIKIRMQSGKGEFTSGWKANMGSADPSKYFTSDNEAYDVFLNNNGEAEIGEYVPFDGSGTEDDPYLIQSADDWDAFAQSVRSKAKNYEGKTIALTADIAVSTMAGSHINGGQDYFSGNGFRGTFDGRGHTITVNFGGSERCTALFPFADDHSVFKNLRVNGSVKGNGVHFSGLVGSTCGTVSFRNVVVAADVSSSHCAGFVGHSYKANISFENCVFCGSINASTYGCGFVGWGSLTNDDYAISLTNCASVGRFSGSGTYHPLGYEFSYGHLTVQVNGFAYNIEKTGSGNSAYNFEQNEINKKVVASVRIGDNTVENVTTKTTYYTTFTEALSNWTNGTTLTLLRDVTTSSTANVSSGEHILDLNGYGIKMTGNASVFTVSSGAKLIINDSDPDIEHRFSLSNAQPNGAGFATVNDSLTSGYQTFKGGYITGGKGNARSSWREGGAIYIEGEVEMNAGTLIGNGTYGSSHGGGFETRESGRFVMNGGSIQNNAALCGGACRLVGGSAEFAGGKVINNVVSNDGGGIHVGGTIPLVLKDCEISGNYANGGPGAGVWMSNDGTTVSGKTVIKDNYVGTREDNIEIPSNRVLYVGELTDGASIGITMQSGPAAFTSGWNDKMGNADPSKYFTSDNNSYSVFLNGSGEAEIGVPPVASIISGETETNYGSISDAVNAWTAGSTLKLLADVTTSSTVTVPAGEHILDLNGYELKRTGATGSDNSGLAVTVNDGVTLTVIGPGKITGGKGFHGGGIHVEGNSTLVLDNCEISGNTGHYGGGLYLSKGTITLKNGTVVKGNSASEGFGGSGIYAEGGGTLILEDSKFINNEIKNNNQYAVFLAGNANVKVSGAPVINDNTYDGKQKDLYLYQAGDQHSNVQVIGELTDGAKIIVGQTTGTGVIGSGWKANMGEVDPADYLVSADTDYVVFANKDDELEIGYPEITGVSAEGFEGDYDGEAHKISVTAPDGATIKYGTTEGSYTLTENPTYTDAGTYTVYYEVSKNKYRSTYGSADVKINKINATVTITGRSLTVDYDGSAHSADGYDAVASSNLYDVNKDFTFSGRAEAIRTNAGTTDMGLTAEQFVNTNSNFATVTFNVTDGFVKVDPINVTVTVTGHNDTVDYNGSAHSVDGYDAVPSTDLYDVTKDFTFSGRAEAVRTNVGTTKMNLSADKFKNTNTNFANVTFNVTDGFLTVNPVDAVITTAPHAKSELIYNGSDQELIAAGAADGGTLYYALGDDAKTAPADESYTTAIPTATQIGNYYIWYMVKGDSNHNDLSPTCVKVTMADQGWGTVSGAVVDENHSPVKNATVSLIIGGRVIDEIASGLDGSYYFTVPAGIYNIVVKSSDATVTEMVNVSDRTTYDLTVPDSDTDSVLDIVDTDSNIVVGGLSKEAAAVRNTEGVSADQNVSVRMTVKTVSESDTTGSQAISGIAGDMFVEYYDCKVEKTVDTVTTSMDKTQTVLELVIPCSYTNKRELTVYNSDGSGAQTLTLSDSREAGTFRVDQNAGLVYIYTDRIATYAVGYKPYYSIKSEVSLGSFSGNVSVKLTKDTTGETYALNNVSLNSISFAGLPKGTYSMTITWTDGAENTLTTPFNIK